MADMNFFRDKNVSLGALEEHLSAQIAMKHLLDVSLVKHNEEENKTRYANRKKSIGAGRVGHPLAEKPYDRGCERAIFYEWKQYPTEKPFPAQLYRTFSLGHATEEIIINNLRAAGFTILTHKTDEAGNLTNEQYGFQLAPDADGNYQYKGFYDGIVIAGPAEWKSPAGDVLTFKYPFLLECKSANHKKFTKFLSDGVVNSHPVYYGQVQSYMNFSGLYQSPALLLMVNKDTGEIAAEFIRYNTKHCQAILDRVARIIGSTNPLQLLRAASDWEMLPCKWCEYRMQCQKDEQERQTISANTPIPGDAPGWLKKE